MKRGLIRQINIRLLRHPAGREFNRKVIYGLHGLMDKRIADNLDRLVLIMQGQGIVWRAVSDEIINWLSLRPSILAVFRRDRLKRWRYFARYIFLVLPPFVLIIR